MGSSHSTSFGWVPAGPGCPRVGGKNPSRAPIDKHQRYRWLSEGDHPCVDFNFIVITGLLPVRMRPVLLFVAAAAAAPVLPPVARHAQSVDLSIVDFGAIADNRTVNTKAIQRAIDSAAQSGGGIVFAPPGGAFKTGALSLRSNVFLFLPSGATILGSADPTDYTDIAGGNWDSWDVLHSNCSNCGLVGDEGATGTLQGPMWQMISGFDAEENQLQPIRWTNISGCVGECRPRLLVFEDSSNVSVTNVQLRDSADWTQVGAATVREERDSEG